MKQREEPYTPQEPLLVFSTTRGTTTIKTILYWTRDLLAKCALGNSVTVLEDYIERARATAAHRAEQLEPVVKRERREVPDRGHGWTSPLHDEQEVEFIKASTRLFDAGRADRRRRERE